MPDNKKSSWLWLLLALSGILYIYFAYFLEREQTAQILTVYTVLFGIYFWVINKKWDSGHLQLLIFGAIGLRLILLFSFPNLSDDIYRFVWDGKLLNAGIHPFSQLPKYYIDNAIEVDGLSLELYSKLNSPEYFTIYPPFAQLIFWLGAAPTSSVHISSIIIRLFIVAAEVGTIFFGYKVLEQWKLPKGNILLYALNPLIILELTGNLHFEAFMIFFMILSIYYINRHKTIQSGVYLALGVAVKLLPLMLLPSLIRKLELKKLSLFYATAGLAILLAFTPLYNQEFVNGMTESIGLYFQKFEFNASIYYLVRAYGFWDRGYNIIQTAGPDLALYSLVGILIISLFFNKKINVATHWQWIITFYLLMATTVHPWYISSLIMFAVFCNYRYAILWSFLIFFTYSSYTSTGFEEQLWLTVVEYVSVLGLMFYEIYNYYWLKRGYEEKIS